MHNQFMPDIFISSFSSFSYYFIWFVFFIFFFLVYFFVLYILFTLCLCVCLHFLFGISLCTAFMVKIQITLTVLHIIMVLTYLNVSEIYLKHKDRANFMKCLHHEVCDRLKIEYSKVNRVSLLYKVKRIQKEIEKLKKYTNKEKLNKYVNNIFELPNMKKTSSDGSGCEEKQSNSSMEREENFKEDTCNTRLQEIISEQSIVITHLRREMQVSKTE